MHTEVIRAEYCEATRHQFVKHCTRDDYDVYVGRGLCPKTCVQSIWGNPFKIGVDGSRDDVIKQYEIYLLNNPELLDALPELRGKSLGCWCFPRECHADILAKYANSPIEICVFCCGDGEKTLWSELYGDIIVEVCSHCSGRGWQYSNPELR